MVSPSMQMEALKSKDPLLLAAKVIIILTIGVAIFAIVMLGIGTVAVLTIQRAEIFASLAEANAPDAAYWALIAVLLGFVCLLWLTYLFFKALLKLVKSVDDGEPFRSSNADLLAEMGWLSVGAQITLFIIAFPANWLISIAETLGEDLQFDIDLGFGSILMTLILFILARVFRHGAAMRDDLDGTV